MQMLRTEVKFSSLDNILRVEEILEASNTIPNSGRCFLN